MEICAMVIHYNGDQSFFFCGDQSFTMSSFFLSNLIYILPKYLLM